MLSPRLPRLTRAMAARMLADTMIVGFSLLAGLALRFLLLFAARDHEQQLDFDQIYWEFVDAFCYNVAPLALLCLGTFAIYGFYTYGRAYQGRYKALIIAQAVSQSYLFMAFFMYFVIEKLGVTAVPRGALVLAWGLNLGLVITTRLWTTLWERVIRPERESRLRVRKGDGKSVLVIGGAGYIGSALLPKLLERGYKVTVLDLFLYGMEPIQAIADHPRIKLVHGDFRHAEKVVQAMRGVDAVVHLGAIVGDPACDLDKQLTIDVNLSATQMIAQVAKASGVGRFVFASTCSVYGACDELLDERSEVKPISLYGETKLAAEHGLESMSGEGFAPTILRFATIYGLSGRTRFDLVVNLLAAKAKLEGQITIDGGNQWRPFVHVDDAAQAVLGVLLSPLSQVGNEVFNVGSDEQNQTIMQVGELINEHVPGSELIVRDNATDRRNYRVSFSKIKNLVGFRPRWTLIEGVRQVLEAIASGDVLDYRDPKYSNVKFLGEHGAIEVLGNDDDWVRRYIQHPRHTPQPVSEPRRRKEEVAVRSAP